MPVLEEDNSQQGDFSREQCTTPLKCPQQHHLSARNSTWKSEKKEALKKPGREKGFLLMELHKMTSSTFLVFCLSDSDAGKAVLQLFGWFL